jgi:hypothetical protein
VPLQWGLERNETGQYGTGRGPIRRELKALAGNSATCLGLCFRFIAGSILATSILSEFFGVSSLK